MKNELRLKGNIIVWLLLCLLLCPNNVEGLTSWTTAQKDFINDLKVNTTLDQNGLRLSNDNDFQDSWHKVGDATGPSPRYQHSMVYDSKNGIHIIFGGNCGIAIRQDTWTYQMSSNAWTNCNPSVMHWLCGYAMAFSTKNNVTVLFGGSDGRSISNETEIYNTDSNTWTFLQHKIPFIAPQPRCFHSMVYDMKGDRFIIFGGRDSLGDNQFVCYNDTWILDLSNNTWINRSTSLAPSARYGQSMCYDIKTGLIVLFGGKNNSKSFNDTWIYDPSINIWEERNPFPCPTSRYGSAMSYDEMNGMSYLFAGDDSTELGNDIWSYTISSNVWIREIYDIGPSPRIFSSMSYDPQTQKIFLFAGRDQNGICLSDYWSFDPLYNVWKKLGWMTAPEPREKAAVAYNDKLGKGVLFGGMTYEFVLNDTWTYDSLENQWEQKHPAISPEPNFNPVMCFDCDQNIFILFIVGQTWIYNLSSDEWFRCQCATTPKSGDDNQLVYDDREHLVIFFSSDPYNETWTYDVKNDIWFNHTNSIAPPAYYDSAMAYDDINEEIILFSGRTNKIGSAAETWILNTSTFIWSKKFTLFSPRPLHDPKMIFNTIMGCVFLIGDNIQSEMWIYNTTNNQWINITGYSPKPRYHIALIYDSVDNILIMFGGFSTTILGETWVYSFWGYLENGFLLCSAKDTEGDAYFGTIQWEKIGPSGTDVKLQFRSGKTKIDLENNNFTGPDGQTTSYFTTSGQGIPHIHDGNRWIQYRVFLKSKSHLATPILSYVTINYNLIQNIILISPLGGENWTGLKKIVWSSYDKDNDNLTYDIYLENDSISEQIVANLSGNYNEWSWNTDFIPNGTYRIHIIAKDNNPLIPLTVNTFSGYFSIYHPLPPVPPNHLPHVRLLFPTNLSYLTTNSVRLQWEGTDADGDQLTYIIYYSDNPIVQGHPNIYITTNEYLDLSNLNDNSTYYWTVDATDKKSGGTDVPTELWSFIIRLPPINIPVRFTSIPLTIAWIGKEYTYNLTSIDEDGDIPIYSISSGVVNMTLNSTTGKLRWIPIISDIGNHIITIQVSDGRGSFDNQTFTISVNEIPAPPIVSPKCFIIFPANGTIVSGTIKIQGIAMNGSLPLSAIKIRMDNGSWEVVTGLIIWTFLLNTVSLANGHHHIEAKAYDANLSSDIASIDIEVNNPEQKITLNDNQLCLLTIFMILIINIIIILLYFKKS